MLKNNISSNTLLYTLELEGGNYYVGVTTDIDRRMSEHESGTGAEWTKRHNVVKLLHTKPITNPFKEDMAVKLLMVEHGIDKVRGGTYSQVNLSSSIMELLKKEIRHASNECFKCGSTDHYIGDCSGSNTTKFVTKIVSKHTSRIVCSRCKRYDHRINTCEEEMKSDGTKLCMVTTLRGTLCRNTKNCSIHGEQSSSSEDDIRRCAFINEDGTECSQEAENSYDECPFHLKYLMSQIASERLAKTTSSW